jgi:microcystin-dependent protein
MAQPFIGEIILFGGNFAPSGYALCNGQLMPVSQNTALFSLLGTTYGGDGVMTFGLPDLRGRIPMHQGQGAGLSNRAMGEIAGVETVTLTTAQMPPHNHGLNAQSGNGDQASPQGNYWAASTLRQYAAPSNSAMNPACIGNAGGSQPHSNIMPFLAVNFAIAVAGIYPSRN